MGRLSFEKELSMRRFWISAENFSNNEVLFEGDDYNHLVRVSRKQVGDKVEVLFGEPKAYEVEITQIDKKIAKAKVIGSRELPVPQEPFVQLAFCFPKPAVFESVIEKCVELGVYSVQPLFNDNSFFKKANDIKDAKWDRWQKIIQAATEQTGRGHLMPILPPENLLDCASKINQSPSELGLFFYEGGSAFPVKNYLEGQKLESFKKITVFIGSEGGFSKEEVGALENLNYKSITVGSQILRAETACVSILSVIKYQLQQMQ